MNPNEHSRNLISVIVPVYKVETYIKDCIYSVIKQTYKNFELILVDDAGGDKSIDIARDMLLSTDINWRIIINSKNRGLAYSRNIGIKNSRGDYLFFLDSDDYIDADCLRNLYKEISETRADMVYGSIVYDVNGMVQQSPWIFTDLDTCSCQPLNLYIKQKAFAMACNRLIDRRFYDKCGICFKEGIVHEDEPWAFSLIIRAKKISFVKNVTYFYRRHSASITSQKLNFFRLNCIFFHLHNISCESYRLSEVWENREFRRWYARLILSYFSNVFKVKLKKNDQKLSLDKVFTELRLPENELNEIPLYSFAQNVSWLFYNYRWLKIVVIFHQVKNYLKGYFKNLMLRT